MSSRLPLGWSKLLEGLPKVEATMERTIKSEELRVDSEKTLGRTPTHGKTKALRNDARSCRHLEPKFLSQVPTTSCIELS